MFGPRAVGGRPLSRLCRSRRQHRCRFKPFLDIDILSPDAARVLEDYVRGRSGSVRIGKPPKPAIPFRTDTPFIRIAISLIAANSDKSQKLE
jgi:hypothetical protein